MAPDFVVDIKNVLDRKMRAVYAFKSQFYDATSKEQETLIARKEFLGLIQSRDIMSGNYAGLDYAEGFISAFKPAVNDFFDLL